MNEHYNVLASAEDSGVQYLRRFLWSIDPVKDWDYVLENTSLRISYDLL